MNVQIIWGALADSNVHKYGYNAGQMPLTNQAAMSTKLDDLQQTIGFLTWEVNKTDEVCMDAVAKMRENVVTRFDILNDKFNALETQAMVSRERLEACQDEVDKQVTDLRKKLRKRTHAIGETFKNLKVWVEVQNTRTRNLQASMTLVTKQMVDLGTHIEGILKDVRSRTESLESTMKTAVRREVSAHVDETQAPTFEYVAALESRIEALETMLGANKRKKGAGSGGYSGMRVGEASHPGPSDEYTQFVRGECHRIAISDGDRAQQFFEFMKQIRPRGAGQGGHSGERIGEASHPGPVTDYVDLYPDTLDIIVGTRLDIIDYMHVAIGRKWGSSVNWHEEPMYTDGPSTEDCVDLVAKFTHNTHTSSCVDCPFILQKLLSVVNHLPDHVFMFKHGPPDGKDDVDRSTALLVADTIPELIDWQGSLLNAFYTQVKNNIWRCLGNPLRFFTRDRDRMAQQLLAVNAVNTFTVLTLMSHHNDYRSLHSYSKYMLQRSLGLESQTYIENFLPVCVEKGWLILFEYIIGPHFHISRPVDCVLTKIFAEDPLWSRLPPDVHKHIHTLMYTVHRKQYPPRMVLKHKLARAVVPPLNATESSDMSDVEHQPGPVCPLVTHRELTTNPMSSVYATCDVMSTKLEQGVIPPMALENNRVPPGDMADLLMEIGDECQAYGFHKKRNIGRDYFNLSIENVLHQAPLLICCVNQGRFRDWATNGRNFVLFNEKDLSNFRLDVAEFNFMNQRTIDDRPQEYQEPYRHFVKDPQWIHLLVNVKFELVYGTETLVVPKQRVVFTSNIGSGKTNLVLKMIEHFALMLRSHPNRISPTNPAVLILPSIVLCNQVYEKLYKAGVSVCLYNRVRAHEWYGKYAVLVVCANSLAHRVDCNRNHSFVVFSEAHQTCMSMLSSFICTRSEGKVVKGAKEKIEHLNALVQNCHVGIFESADNGPAELLCAIQNMQDIKLEDVFVRVNLAKPIEKKTMLFYDDTKTWIHQLFSKITQTGGHKKYVVTCDSRADIRRLCGVVRTFLEKQFGPQDTNAEYERIQTLTSKSTDLEREHWLNQEKFAKMCTGDSGVVVFLVSPTITTGFSWEGRAAAHIDGVFAINACYGNHSIKAETQVQMWGRVRPAMPDKKIHVLNKFGHKGEDSGRLLRRPEENKKFGQLHHQLEELSKNMRGDYLHDFFDGTKIPDIGSVWRRFLMFTKHNTMKKDPAIMYTQELQHVMLTVKWHNLKFILDVAENYHNYQFLRRLVDCVYRQGHKVDFHERIDMDALDDKRFAETVSRAAFGMFGRVDQNPVAISEDDSFTLETKMRTQTATENEQYAYMCREFGRTIGISHDAPNYEQTMSLLKDTFKFKTWGDDTLTWLVRMKGLVLNVIGHSHSTEDVTTNQKIWIINSYVNAIGAMVRVRAPPDAPSDRKVWNPFIWYIYSLILSTEQENLPVPTSVFDPNDTLPTVRALWRLDTADAVGENKVPETFTLGWLLKVLGVLLKKEFNLKFTRRTLGPIQIQLEQYSDRNAYYLDRSQMTLFWAMFPASPKCYDVLQKNNAKENPLTGTVIPPLRNFGHESIGPFWYTVILNTNEAPIRVALNPRDKYTRWGPIVFVDEEEEADDTLSMDEEADDDSDVSSMDEDIPRRATSFLEDEADGSDHSGQDGDELEENMVDDPFIDDSYRPDSPPVMPFPDADPWAYPDWLQSTVDRIEQNASTAVDDMWITTYCDQ